MKERKKKASILTRILAALGGISVIIGVVFCIIGWVEYCYSDRMELARSRSGYSAFDMHDSNWTRDCETWPEKGEYVAWSEVHNIMSSNWSCRAGRKCNGCGKKCIVIKYISPSWTWEQGIGREGWLELCPTCHRQYSLKLDKTD